jgi:hypothetical protein
VADFRLTRALYGPEFNLHKFPVCRMKSTRFLNDLVQFYSGHFLGLQMESAFNRLTKVKASLKQVHQELQSMKYFFQLFILRAYCKRWVSAASLRPLN